MAPGPRPPAPPRAVGMGPPPRRPGSFGRFRAGGSSPAWYQLVNALAWWYRLGDALAWLDNDRLMDPMTRALGPWGLGRGRCGLRRHDARRRRSNAV